MIQGADIMKFSSRLCIVLGLVLMSSCSTDQEATVNSIEITEFGIFEYNSIRFVPDETSSVGAKLGVSKGLQLSSQTTRIPIRPGLSYGVQFVVRGNPTDATVDIGVILRSTSACVLRDTGQVVYHNDSLLKVRIGETRYITGRFPVSEKEDHCIGEPQPGTDTFELYHGDRKLAEKTFEIIKE